MTPGIVEALRLMADAAARALALAREGDDSGLPDVGIAMKALEREVIHADVLRRAH